MSRESPVDATPLSVRIARALINQPMTASKLAVEAQERDFDDPAECPNCGGTRTVVM
jgi:hypothetical protein